MKISMLFVTLLMFFGLCLSSPAFCLEKDEITSKILSLLYKCEIELRIYSEEPEMLWRTIGKIDAYFEIIELLEEDSN